MRAWQQTDFTTQFTNFGELTTIRTNTILDDTLTNVLVNGKLEGFVILALGSTVVITNLLGVPYEDAGKIKHWSDVWVEPLAYGLTGLLRSLGFHNARHKLYLPLDLLHAVGLTPEIFFDLRDDPRVDAERKSGYWVNENRNYMENDPVLVTAYAMLSLECVLGRGQ